VSAMLRIGRTLAEKSQEEAYTLLDALYETVTEIFAGEEKNALAEERGAGVGRLADLTPSGAAGGADVYARQKPLSGSGDGPDVTGHQLSRSKGAT